MAGFGDLTGKNKQNLEQEHAAELAAKQKSLALAAEAIQNEANDEPVELKTNEQIEASAPRLDGDIEIQAIDETEKIVTFKVNSTLEQVTIGYGNNYDFEQGRTYKAPQSVYDFLDSKGLIWH